MWWMTDYIREIKRQLRDVYHFQPTHSVGGPPSSDEYEPVFGEGQIPDGEYPMTIEGRLDRVKIVGGKIDCCHFEE